MGWRPGQLPLEIFLSIMNAAGFPGIIRFGGVSKAWYFYYKEKIIIPWRTPFLDFTQVHITYLHRALMHNKLSVIKWMLKNKAYSPKKTMLFMKVYTTADRTKTILQSHFFLDITLIIAFFFCPKKTIHKVMELGVQSQFYELERLILQTYKPEPSLINAIRVRTTKRPPPDAEENYRNNFFENIIEDYEKILFNSCSNVYGRQLSELIQSLRRYKLRGEWYYAEKIFL